METFTLLADPSRYVACDWDLTADAAGRAYWIGHFRTHFDHVAELIRVQYRPTDARLAEFARDYRALIDRMESAPAEFGRLTIIRMDTERDTVLRRFGFADPFAHIKDKENAAALSFYPRLIAELTAQPPERRLAELIAGVFAGNIFDLGAMATLKQYQGGQLDFFATRAGLPARPWLFDGHDAMTAAWSADRWRYRKVVFFVDNAGCDFVLGCLPLIREMATERGARVVIAANTGPSLNDVTDAEAEQVLAVAARSDRPLADALADGRIAVVGSGNGAPLIDLANVSEELNAAADGADLLVIEGMGRSIESNFHARFTVDTARMALLKDEQVARRVGGGLFDIVCRFDPAR